MIKTHAKIRKLKHSNTHATQSKHTLAPAILLILGVTKSQVRRG
jgi:hypothetical protein